MTIHFKAAEQYFTVVLFVNPLTPRVKPWVMQSFLTFDSMDRTLKCDHSLESCGMQYFTVVLFVNPLTPRVKPWVMQSFLTFDSMDRTLKCDHSLESTLLWCCSILPSFTQFWKMCEVWTGTVRSEGVKTLLSIVRVTHKFSFDTFNV